MGAPVKAYTNPTGLSRMLVAVDAGQVPEVSIRLARCVAMPLGRLGGALVMSVTMPPQRLEVEVPAIPPPPMGKLMLSTFPPAYKSTTVRVGQIYPRGVR